MGTANGHVSGKQHARPRAGQVDLNKIPISLRELPQWVLWKFGARKQGDKPTKLPFQVNGSFASANKPETWATFEAVSQVFQSGGYSGIGFEFSANDPFCGIDLDGCRNPDTDDVAEWAREIVLVLNTYTEVSPSGSGVKLFMRGKLPIATGRKKELDVEKLSDKTPAIEIYDWGRYFAVSR
jgi:putative DNA primase/helicase